MQKRVPNELLGRMSGGGGVELGAGWGVGGKARAGACCLAALLAASRGLASRGASAGNLGRGCSAPSGWCPVRPRPAAISSAIPPGHQPAAVESAGYTIAETVSSVFGGEACGVRLSQAAAHPANPLSMSCDAGTYTWLRVTSHPPNPLPA